MLTLAETIKRRIVQCGRISVKFWVLFMGWMSARAHLFPGRPTQRGFTLSDQFPVLEFGSVALPWTYVERAKQQIPPERKATIISRHGFRVNVAAAAELASPSNELDKIF